MNNLASALYNSGKYEKAEKFFRRLVPLSEAAWGPTHYNAISSKGGLANALDSLKLYGEADKLYVSEYPRPFIVSRIHPLTSNTQNEVISLSKAQFGPAHPATLIAIKDFAEARRLRSNS